MQKLLVNNFSCLKSADIEFSRLTLLIGPQASGKSVLCKLSYFFLSFAQAQFTLLMKGADWDKVQIEFKQQFFEWFPPEAWGKDRFEIDYCCGDYRVTLTRIIYKKKVKDDFRIKFSSEFRNQYEALLASQAETRAKNPKVSEVLFSTFELEWKYIETSRESITKLMGQDFYNDQIFIPAGRSFFTSLDKAISIFEQARSIDPLILRFGKLYNTLRENDYFHVRSSKERDLYELISGRMTELFGGSVEKENDIVYIRTNDGRRVRLTALSSGQQELFPLVTTIPYILMRGDRRSLCFIEEPEAHLFPKSQSILVETLIMLLSAVGKSSNGLVLTTHSPYVLAKINNLIKAGTLGRKSADAAKKVDAVVPRRAWLSARYVRAYAIKDGIVHSIMDKDNFINADYLDDISNDISSEFDSLLELEAGIA